MGNELLSRPANNTSDTLLLTPEETARELRIAKRRVWDLIRGGELASVKIGKSRRISRAALEEYVAGLSSPGGETETTGPP